MLDRIIILIECKKLFLFSRLGLKSKWDCSMKNMIYKYFISRIRWVICITLMLFDEFYKTTSLAGSFSDL